MQPISATTMVDEEPSPEPGGASEWVHRSVPPRTLSAWTTALMRSSWPSIRTRRGWSYLATVS